MYKDKDKQREAQKRYEEKRKGTRFKCWSLIFYPDSAPAEWVEMIQELHLMCWVSPVHDRDCWTSADEKKNPEHVAGTFKKAHYHLVVEYPNPISAEDFLKDFAFLKGSKYAERVRDKIPMIRYLIHKDDPQKAQYNSEDICLFGGANLDIIEQLGTSERHIALREMRKYIIDNNIIDFYEFVLYCDDCMESWSRLIDDNSCYVIERFIKSFRASLGDKKNYMFRNNGNNEKDDS